MWENREIYNGISLLDYDGGSYPQMPFEDCSEDQYLLLSKSLEEVCSKADAYGIKLNKDRSADLINSVLKNDIDTLIRDGYTPEALDSVMFKVEVIQEFAIPVRFSDNLYDTTGFQPHSHEFAANAFICKM